MSSSYNNSISSSSTQSFPLFDAATGANNFNGEEMAMIQQPNSVSPPPPSPPRRVRNRPGNPSPDAEVIALSPESIMTPHRFTCEVCKKGFKREQNLQLHGRGHNLPYNLKQKPEEEVRKKVYVCPEPTCVYHDPTRALGDLTGIKKHYFRKHGEKKFKCEKCSKCYAVESDYKAHSKVCGTKEYRCDCGTTFSRRDSYETHRAFCDALIQESARNPNVSFADMAAAGGGSGGRQGFYGGASSSALTPNHFGNNLNTGFTPLAASYNLNRPSPERFENFVPHSTNPNLGPTNYPMQPPLNQGLLAHYDQNLMNQHGLINSNSNSNLFNIGQDNTTNYDHTRVPSLFNNNPSALLRGFSSSPSLSGVVNNSGGSANGNFQGPMNSLAAARAHQGWSGSSVFDHHLRNNLSMGRSDRQTLDFLGVDGANVSNVYGPGGRNGANVSNVYGPGGRNGPPLDFDMKFSDPNNPFGNV